MEKRINIAGILKDCPKGMDLDCTMFNNVKLKYVSVYKDENFPICIETKSGHTYYLTKYGQINSTDDAKCIIFPKGKDNWKDFVPPCNIKDGDILISVHGNPFIFKETHNDKICGCYCGIAQYGELGIESPHWTSNYNLRLATEEEKQKLFDAIRENGYKWNSETKTLEKLIVPKFKVGDRIKYRDDEIICRIVKITEDTYELDNHHSIPISLEYKYNLVPNKFDISTLKTFDKVLVWDDYTGKWNIDFFGRFDDNSKLFKTMTGSYSQCIPYEDNKHLFDTDEDCIEYYKIWEE